MGQVDNARARDQGMKLNQLLMERQNRQFQREDQEYANQEAIKGAYRGSIGQDGTLDQNMLLSKLYEVDPIKANEVQQQFATQKAASQKAGLENQKAELALMADKAKLGRDLIASLTPENYAQGIQQLQAQGFQVAQSAPAQYDPNWIQQSVMDAGAFIKQLETKQQQEFTAGQNQLNRDVTMRGQNITASNAAASRELTRRGQDIQLRGQDITAQTAREKRDNPTKKGLSAAAQKEIFNADDIIESSDVAKTAFEQALAINDKAMGGYGAGALATAGTVLPDMLRPEAVDATKNLDNILQGSALPQLKAIFGGMPTEGERAILLEVQGSSSQPAKVREQIFNRAIKAIERRKEFNKRKAEKLRSGEYFESGGGVEMPAIETTTSTGGSTGGWSIKKVK